MDPCLREVAEQLVSRLPAVCDQEEGPGHQLQAILGCDVVLVKDSVGTLVTSQCTYTRKAMPSSRIMMVNRSPLAPLHLTLGLSFICPVSIVSPTPGENRGHLMEASWPGGEESLEGTTETQSEGVTATGAELVVVSRPGSTLLVLVLVVKVGAAGWAGVEG